MSRKTRPLIPPTTMRESDCTWNARNRLGDDQRQVGKSLRRASESDPLARSHPPAGALDAPRGDPKSLRWQSRRKREKRDVD